MDTVVKGQKRDELSYWLNSTEYCICECGTQCHDSEDLIKHINEVHIKPCRNARKENNVDTVETPKHPLLDIQYNLIFTSKKYPQFDNIILSGGQYKGTWYWWFDKTIPMYHGNEWSIKSLVKNIRDKHNKTTKILYDTFLF